MHADRESALFVEFHISVICWFLTKQNCKMELEKKNLLVFTLFICRSVKSAILNTKKVPMKGKTPCNV